MIDSAVYSLRGYEMRSYLQLVVSRTLFATGIISLTLNCGVSQAQFNQTKSKENALNKSENNIFQNRSNNIKPVRQRYFYPDASGSQQFFRQDSDRIYFLPEENSSPILQINEDIETEEVEEDRKEKPSDK